MGDFWSRILLKAEEAWRAGRLGLLIDYKRGLIQLEPREFSDPSLRRLQELLRDVPEEGYTCACCGRRLKNPQIARDGAIVGPECINHYPERRCRG